MVSSALVTAAMVGSLVYPPLMGVLSDALGLGVGMAGAGVFSLVAAGAIIVAARVTRPPVTPASGPRVARLNEPSAAASPPRGEATSNREAPRLLGGPRDVPREPGQSAASRRSTAGRMPPWRR